MHTKSGGTREGRKSARREAPSIPSSVYWAWQRTRRNSEYRDLSEKLTGKGLRLGEVPNPLCAVALPAQLLMRFGFTDSPDLELPQRGRWGLWHEHPAAVILTGLPCRCVREAAPVQTSGRFLAGEFEDVRSGEFPHAHPEILYLAIDMREGRREIRQAVDQAVRKWLPITKTARKRKSKGHDKNFPLYLRAWDLRKSGLTWKSVARDLFPRETNPEGMIRKARAYYERGRRLIDDLSDLRPAEGPLAPSNFCPGTKHHPTSHRHRRGTGR